MYRIKIAKGDGIGPEIMDARLAIVKVAGALLENAEIEVDEKVNGKGNNQFPISSLQTELC